MSCTMGLATSVSKAIVLFIRSLVAIGSKRSVEHLSVLIVSAFKV